MKIICKSCITVFIIVLLGACGNETDDIVIDSGQPKETLFQLKSENVKMQTMAKIVSGIANDPQAVAEVKWGVESSCTFGLDEEWRFTDILQPKISKTLRMTNSSVLANYLKHTLSYGNSSGNLKSASTNDLQEFILNENIQIYWPYSENWDGVSAPVITFDPGTDEADKLTAYRQVEAPNGTMVLDSLIVDEVYAKQHPVWVINQNDLDYSKLPNFSEGEFIKDGTLFSCNLSQEHNEKIGKSLRSEDIAVFKLGTLQVLGNHDDWANGGSEFEFKCSSPLSPSYTTAGVTVIRRSISRKNIDKGTSYILNEPLNTNWTIAQEQNGLKIIETDGGGTASWSAKLFVVLAGKRYGLNAVIPYGSKDDDIYQTVLARNYILSSENLYSIGNPITNEREHVRWTMFLQSASYIGM